MEKEPRANDEQENPREERNDSVDFVRHSKSAYRTYEKILKSDDPTVGFKKEEQVTPDLPEAGIELAKKEAERFFETLDPEKDILFFVSSNEARAVETANIYREIARAKGFQVAKPDHARSKISEDIAGGEVRVINGLSIYNSRNAENMLADSVFNLSNKGLINWDNIDPELKTRYEEASAIIEADNQGSFGANFAKHGERIKEILPEIETAEEQFKGKFKNLKRLAKFGIKKAKEGGQEKDVKILAFGHENYMMYAIQNVFGEEGIKNCEAVHITVKGDSVKGEFRGKEVEL